MKIKVDIDFIVVDGVMYRRGSVLEYELKGHDKDMLVLNRQAQYDYSKDEPKPKEDH